MELFQVTVYDDGKERFAQVIYPEIAYVARYDNMVSVDSVNGQVIIRQIIQEGKFKGFQLPVLALPVDKCIVTYQYKNQ